MKHLIAFTLLMLLSHAISINAAEENTIYPSSVAMTKGTTEAQLNIYMTNAISMCGYELYLQLPEGISIKYGYDEDEEEDRFFIEKGGRARDSHVLSCSKRDDGTYYIFCYDPNNRNFYDSDAKKSLPLITMTLSVNNTANTGANDIVIKGIIMNHNSDQSVIEEYKPQDTASEMLIRPASGIEISEKDYAVSIASAKGVKVSKSQIASALEEKIGLTSVDMRATELGDDITSTDDLKTDGMSENVLFFMPEESVVTGNNVIVNGSCDKFAITDGENIKCPRGFNALVATYKRNFKNHAWQPLYLPFAVVADVLTNDFDIAKFSNSQDNEKEINIENITSGTLEANSPYLIRLKDERALGEYDIPGESDVEKTLDKEMTVGPYYRLKTTYKEISGTDLQGKYALVGGVFKKAGNSASLGAFRIYLEAIGSNAKDEISLSFDEPAGIEEVQGSKFQVQGTAYNLNGVRVDSGYNGIVIVNGRKEIWR